MDKFSQRNSQEGNPPSVIEIRNTDGCYAWSFQDIGIGGKLADGLVYIKHHTECRCLKNIRLETLVAYANKMVHARQICEQGTGELIIRIKLGLAVPDNMRIEPKGPESEDARAEIAEGVRFDEFAEWGLVEADDLADDPWQAVLLPVYGKDIAAEEKEKMLSDKDSYSIGDMVFILPKERLHGMRTKMIPKHFEDYVLGPYEIVNVFENTCALELPDGLRTFPIVHKSFLSKFVQEPVSPRPKTHRAIKKQNKMLNKDLNSRTQIGHQPKKILEAESRKEIYYRVQVAEKEPSWMHSSWLETSQSELNEFYVANPNAVKPGFYSDYLDGLKKTTKRPGLHLPWNRKSKDH
ncbi:hypothetical protein F4778DRAFT_637089 [Xylariomycetidae sp. FL2044]|nr:hypothetical protein F4778DRAFT_637089 [Xylariomycetidae sp. FL2044]